MSNIHSQNEGGEHRGESSHVCNRYLSPLRYPGGKATWVPLLKAILAENSLLKCHYYEPFAGGAGAAFKLLRDGAVKTIHLNDADYKIYIFWKTIFNRNEEFAEAVAEAKIDISEWSKQFAICMSPNGHTEFSIAYATFYMNRCNRSGIILGSRPVGGMKQSGDLKIDARFNRIALSERIRAIIKLKDAVHLYNLDALAFMRDHVNNNKKRKFVYLDPPYFAKGRRLYLNYYSAQDHKSLANYMKTCKSLNWIMSYDAAKTIMDYYASLLRAKVKVGYSLQSTRCSEELLIAPARISLTFSCSGERRSQREARLRLFNANNEFKEPVAAAPSPPDFPSHASSRAY